MPQKTTSETSLFSRNVVEFVTVAVEYCNFIENSQEISAFDFSKTINKILPLTYLKASMLPNIDIDEECSSEDFVNEDIYNYVQNLISVKFGENDLDCDVPETTSQNGENTTAIISEILADIYQDLKNFTMNYRTNNELVMIESLYNCKLNFEQYWGERLLSALLALHKLIFGNTDWELNDVKTNNKEINTDNWLISQRQQEWENEL
ncbi:MAG: DUF5063 domain-containing protein [Bacteroidetes bacterium CG_4_10_14_3_um_filter_31_20]|nr:MAG: DUF5063 domain-containing protein [Bacteroidetes bacterium CG_4_10_14_3_um_filter_31_20]